MSIAIDAMFIDQSPIYDSLGVTVKGEWYADDSNNIFREFLRNLVH